MATDITGISSASYGSTITNATSSNDEVSKDQFLRLLTYQLQAQNPLEPYDNQEFASQLLNFHSWNCFRILNQCSSSR
jgi:flagellar basal-body rod modification protein FlgD